MSTTQPQPPATPEATERPVSRLARFGFWLAAVCAAAAVFSGIGYRLGLWHFRSGFVILRWAAYGGLAAAVISLVGAIRAWPGSSRRGFAWAILGLVIGLVTVGIPWHIWNTVKTVPFIHDITTDTDNPPRFVAILPLRQNAENTVDYAGPQLAAKQKEGYPDLGPGMLDVPPGKVFNDAQRVARDMGWEIVAAVPGEGRIEATDMTLLYGFTDDVVVRITPSGQGTRVDVRSVSRMGKSDIGVNAKRIRTFLAKLGEASK